MTEISVSRKRKQKSGRPTRLTADIALGMMAIQAENIGKFSYRGLCGKMKVENMDSAASTTGGVRS